MNTSYSNNTWGAQQNNVYGMGYPAPSPAVPVYDQHSHIHGGGYPSASPAVPSYSDPFSTSVQQNVRLSWSQSELSFSKRFSLFYEFLFHRKAACSHAFA